jgi:hypothetical protein
VLARVAIERQFIAEPLAIATGVRNQVLQRHQPIQMHAQLRVPDPDMAPALPAA